MDQHSASVITDVISKLQTLLGNYPAASSSEPKAASIPEFDSNLAKCLERAKAVAPELYELTSIYGQATSIMKAILGYSKTCKKYTAQQQEKLKQKIIDISKKVDDLEKKSPDFSDHCRTFREIMQTAFWVFVPAPEFLFKGSVESADFWALKFMKKKNLQHNDWYKLFQIAVRSLQKFVLADYATGITFNFHGEDRWNSLLNSQTPSSTAPEKVKEPAAQKQAPSVPIKKAKKKEMVGQTCTLSNYENDELVLKSDEIQMKHGIFIENSKHLRLKIDAKCKSVVINRCEDLTLEIKSCISGVQVISSKGVKVCISERTPSFSVDTSQSVSLVLNELNLQCDIVSSKTSQFSVAIKREDGSESKAHPVSSQLVTKWDPQAKQFKTSVYDKFL